MVVETPSNLEFGTVTGRFIEGSIDSSDVDTKFDYTAMSGTVVFTASATKVVNRGALPDPAIMGQTQIRAGIDYEGYLCTMTTTGEVLYRGVNLLANDSEGLLPVSWYWTVSYNLKSGGQVVSGFMPHPIFVSAGSVQDLSNYIVPDGAPAPTETQIIATQNRAVQLVAEATVVRDDMEGLIDNLGEYIVTDAIIAPDGRLYFVRPDDSEVTAGYVPTAAQMDLATTAVQPDDLALALASKAPLASPAFTGTVTGITASMVGLGSVSNTSDSTKNSATATLTNKRITKRSTSNTTLATLTISSDAMDLHVLTAQSTALTIAAPTGTPTLGQQLWIRIKDDGTARAITWNAAWRGVGVTLPATTTAGKTMYIEAMRNTTDSTWDVIDVKVQS